MALRIEVGPAVPADGEFTLSQLCSPAISPDDQLVPIIAVEEIIRGRLNVVRQAEAGKGRVTVERAYQLFEQSLATCATCGSFR